MEDINEEDELSIKEEFFPEDLNDHQNHSISITDCYHFYHTKCLNEWRN